VLVLGASLRRLEHLSSQLVPSPAGTANRCRTGQDLHLNRTMLSDHESPYVGRSPATGIDLQPQTRAAHQLECRPEYSDACLHGPAVQEAR